VSTSAFSEMEMETPPPSIGLEPSSESTRTRARSIAARGETWSRTGAVSGEPRGSRAVWTPRRIDPCRPRWCAKRANRRPTRRSSLSSARRPEQHTRRRSSRKASTTRRSRTRAISC
jgi:hypothetical protein